MNLSELIRCPFVLHQCHVLFKEITPHSIVHRQSQSIAWSLQLEIRGCGHSILFNTSASRIVVPDSAINSVMVIIAVSSLELFYKAVFFCSFRRCTFWPKSGLSKKMD
ncbi:hypothetical protein Peur_035481 [Populus x canadensis]